MRYQTEAVGETTYLLGEFATGETVTISLYKISTGTSVTIDSSSCSEIGTTGFYKWSTTNITTPETSKTDYLYIMIDSNSYTYSGKFVVGGYVDNVNTTISSRSIPNEYDTVLSNIQSDLDNPDQYKADVTTLATSSALATVDGIVDNILIDTNELQTNQNNWNTATGFATQNPPSQNLDDYKATGFSVPNEYDTVISNIQADLDNPDQYKADVTNIENDLKRVLGLMHENIMIDTPIYDGDDNLTSARVRIYSDSSSVGTTNNVIGTYTITSVANGANKFTEWKQVKQ